MPTARILANSVRFALPSITAPALRNFVTSVASFFACASASASDPAVVCSLSPVAMLSFSRIGMPCSGKRLAPGLAASIDAAIASASGFTSRTEFNFGPARS